MWKSKHFKPVLDSIRKLPELHSSAMSTGRRRITELFFGSDEAPVFMLGSFMLILWVCLLAGLRMADCQVWDNMLQMGFVHMLAGRAGSIAEGLRSGMQRALVAAVAVYLDVMIMFIVYPVLIFSYRNCFERRFFQEHMRPIFDTARKSMGRLRGFKILGIFLFVWFPLWMTGIIAGAVIGYLLGLRTWVTMTTVILGSTTAIVMWVYVLGGVFSTLRGAHRAIPGCVTLAIILVLAVSRLRAMRRKQGVGEAGRIG